MLSVCGTLLLAFTPAPSLFDELARLDKRRWPTVNASTDILRATDEVYEGAVPADPYHETNHVVLSLPRKAVLTEEDLRRGPLQHFLGSPSLGKDLVRRGIKHIPHSFLLAFWYLFQLHADGQPHADPLWHAWAVHHRTARTNEHALFRWTLDELALLEEERLHDSAVEYRKGARELYDAVLVPMVGNFTAFFPRRIDFEAFLEALAIGAGTLVSIDGLGGAVLCPLPLRPHPHGAVRLEEVEQEILTPRGEVRHRRMVQVVASRTSIASSSSGASVAAAGGSGGGGGALAGGGTISGLHGTDLRAGHELTLASPKHNDALLLDRGYLWDELRCASVPIRMSLATSSDTPSVARRREQLMEDAGLNISGADFTLTHGRLPPKLLLWAHVAHANESEIDAAASFEDLESAASLGEVSAISAYGSLLRSIEPVRARFEHEIEEDDIILEVHRKALAAQQTATTASAAGAAGKSAARGVVAAAGVLPPRALLAVTNRRFSKMVLDDALKRILDAHSADEDARYRGKLPTPKAKALPAAAPPPSSPRDGSAADDAGGGGGGGAGGGGGGGAGYSTSRERKRAEAERRKKEEKKRKRRERIQQQQQAASASGDSS